MKVEFHSGVADKLVLACRFLRNAQNAGASVVVCADGSTLDQLDVALWSFDPLSFVVHGRLEPGATPSPALARTTVWLVDDAAFAPTHDVLVNLGPTMVEGWEQFTRVVEIVSAQPEDAQAGRDRWRRYGDAPGVERVHHSRRATP